jgi:hypothetical protein
MLALLMLQGPAGAAPGGGGDEAQQTAGQAQQVGQPQADQPQSNTPPPPGAPRQGNPPKTKPAQPVSPAPSAPATGDDTFSVERLREELERKPTIAFNLPNQNQPTFKVEVQGKRWELPNLQTRMAKAIPKMPVQVPFGGTNAADIARLNTPPEFFGSAPFTNGDLLKMEALSGAYGLAGALIKRAIAAHQGAEAAQIREQIRQELAAIDEHNARVAAGQADDDNDTKKPDKDKKKPDDKKK